MNSLTKFPLLHSDEIHIWSASLICKPNYVSYYTSILSKDELIRANNFKYTYHKERYIVARGVLRHLLAIYLYKLPKSIDILYGKWGKPHLKRDFNLQFNLSHSKDFALYVLVKNCDAGVDIEYIDRNLPLEDLATLLFSHDELAYWKKQSNNTKIDYFYKRWVINEAYLKAIGTGLLGNRSLFTKDKSKNLSVLESNPKENTLYYFHLMPEYASALYVTKENLKPIHFAWYPEMINTFFFAQ